MDGVGRTRGQALPIAALQLWVLVGVTLVLVMLGGRAVDRSRAQAAADAVALGVANGGDGSRIAGANGVRVESLDIGDVVDVVVGRGEVQAAARAVRPPRGGAAGLDPRVIAALGRAEALLGESVPIVSGLRTRAEQERLWANRHTNPYPVARPGTSAHERGLAVDVPLAIAWRLAAISADTGLCQPLPASDPVHFELC